MKKVLIINGHQQYEGVAEGNLAKLFIDLSKDYFQDNNFEIIESNIYDYDVKEEVEKMLEADYIHFHMPVYWFGTPWMTKKYLDDVFNEGLFTKTLLEHDGRVLEDPTKQYGTAGHMKAKLLTSVTLNAPKEAFDDNDLYLLKGKSLNDLLMPLTSIFKFCGSEILDSFGSYDVMKNPDVDGDKERFIKYLESNIK